MEKTKNVIIGIYKITSPSGKIYIGQTTNWKKRLGYYNRLECKGQVKLYNSLVKYKSENHIFEFIEECSSELLNEREIYWGDFYDVLGENGLNLKELGIGGKWNDEMKAKMKERCNTPEHKAFISNIHKGKITSSEIRAKMSETHLSMNKTQPEELKIKRGLYKKHSPEHIERFIKSASKPIIHLPSEVIYESITQAAKILGIDHSNIIRILKGRQNNYKGTTFKYI